MPLNVNLNLNLCACEATQKPKLWALVVSNELTLISNTESPSEDVAHVSPAEADRFLAGDAAPAPVAAPAPEPEDDDDDLFDDMD